MATLMFEGVLRRERQERKRLLGTLSFTLAFLAMMVGIAVPLILRVLHQP